MLGILGDAFSTESRVLPPSELGLKENEESTSHHGHDGSRRRTEAAQEGPWAVFLTCPSPALKI